MASFKRAPWPGASSGSHEVGEPQLTPGAEPAPIGATDVGLPLQVRERAAA